MKWTISIVHARKISVMSLRRSAIILPSPLQRRLEAAAMDFIRPDFGLDADFASPTGEPALASPHSVSWRVFKNPLSLFIGGIAAVILELAEPRVRTGVWNHTTFRQDPLRRMRRTGLAAMMTVYGPRSQAEAMIARVRAMHARISGLTPDGTPYRADDPELLTWVHATASFGFLEAYNAYVRPVEDAERNRFYAEGMASASLYGMPAATTSQEEFDMLLETMRNKLEPSPIIFEFLDIMRRVPLLPRPIAAIQGWLVKAAIEIMPGWVRKRLELTEGWNLQRWQRHAIKCSGAAIDRIPLRSGPAVQACRRMGLPDDYLYTR